MTGLNNNEQDFYLGLLASSERLHAEAEKIKEGLFADYQKYGK